MVWYVTLGSVTLVGFAWGSSMVAIIVQTTRARQLRITWQQFGIICLHFEVFLRLDNVLLYVPNIPISYK